MKKEMDVKLNSESMYNLGNLALSIHGRGGGLGGPDVEEEEDMVKVNTFENNIKIDHFIKKKSDGLNVKEPQEDKSKKKSNGNTIRQIRRYIFLMTKTKVKIIVKTFKQTIILTKWLLWLFDKMIF